MAVAMTKTTGVTCCAAACMLPSFMDCSRSAYSSPYGIIRTLSITWVSTNAPSIQSMFFTGCSFQDLPASLSSGMDMARAAAPRMMYITAWKTAE